MANEKNWNDQARVARRERLRLAILGELRLAKRSHEEILEFCHEVQIEEGDCPELEMDAFIAFAAEELNRLTTKLASESVDWPQVTDCDRLDHVEVILRERGILLWQVSPCCDTCTLGELSDRANVINGRYPGFLDCVRGYTFFIDQHMPEMLADSTMISVYLAYGWLSPDESEVAPEIYESNALGIAREVCQCLHEEGFEADWNGDFSRKIGVSLNWQRRTTMK